MEAGHSDGSRISGSAEVGGARWSPMTSNVAKGGREVPVERQRGKVQEK